MVTFFTILLSLLLINILLLIFSVNKNKQGSSTTKQHQLSIPKNNTKEVEIRLNTYKKAV